MKVTPNPTPKRSLKQRRLAVKPGFESDAEMPSIGNGRRISVDALKEIKPTEILRDFSELVQCKLCKGFLIDAVTLAECTHNFCRSCILKYLDLENDTCCPTCRTEIHKTRPKEGIRTDSSFQDLIYRLVPDLYKNEIKRRREFYRKNVHLIDGLSKEETGERCERLIFSSADYINLTVEYFPDVKPPVLAPQSKQAKFGPFLQCAAAMKIQNLVNFVRKMFNLDPLYQVEFFCKQELLERSHTMMDLAYIYSYKISTPIQLYYIIIEPGKNREDYLIPDEVVLSPIQRSIKRKSSKSSDTDTTNVASIPTTKKPKTSQKVENLVEKKKLKKPRPSSSSSNSSEAPSSAAAPVKEQQNEVSSTTKNKTTQRTTNDSSKTTNGIAPKVDADAVKTVEHNEDSDSTDISESSLCIDTDSKQELVINGPETIKKTGQESLRKSPLMIEITVSTLDNMSSSIPFLVKEIPQPELNKSEKENISIPAERFYGAKNCDIPNSPAIINNNSNNKSPNSEPGFHPKEDPMPKIVPVDEKTKTNDNSIDNQTSAKPILEVRTDSKNDTDATTPIANTTPAAAVVAAAKNIVSSVLCQQQQQDTKDASSVSPALSLTTSQSIMNAFLLSNISNSPKL